MRTQNNGVLGIIGTGLIGASIGHAARAAGWRVVGYDARAEASREAVTLGAIDEIVERAELYARGDLIAIALPVDATVDELAWLRREPRAQARAIFDVASVKEPIARAGEGLERFVPSHPMAGSERSGPAAARGDLFVERTWAYVDTGESDAVEYVRAFIRSLGAKPVAVDAVDHDCIVACTSHVPQIVASIFTAQLGESYADAATVDALCGPAARELRRLGRSDGAMWREIVRHNAPNIAPELRALARSLHASADAISDGDAAFVDELFARAADASRRFG